jgi:hypothetical protein
MKSILIAVTWALTLVPAASFAGDLVATSVPLGEWSSAATVVTTGHSLFFWNVFAGRSYCAETSSGAISNVYADSKLSVFGIVGTDPSVLGSLIAANDDETEPQGGNLSRACYIAPASGLNTAEIKNFYTTETGSYRMRVSETTLYGNYFIVGSGYEAFVLMRNTTNTLINVKITLRTTGGAVLGSVVTAAVPVNGSLNYALSAAPFSVAPVTAGTIEVASDGPVGGISGTVTSLSFTGGTSFDARLEARRSN